MSREPSSKRKSTSAHRSDRLERLAENHIYMKASALLKRSSKELCKNLLAGSRLPRQYPCYPFDQVSDVLERVRGLNESRLQRDITPWVVPSPENLYLSGEAIPDYIGEEIHAIWTRCGTMGSTKPKPDFTVGLLRRAFGIEEIEKLQNYATFERPFFFTPNLCLPFLICEAKTGEEGLGKADRQSLHSASIAVRAVIDLYKAAFSSAYPDRVKELSGQILVFTVCHNDSQVNFYGHYAVISDDLQTLDFHRYDIAMFSFRVNDGADRYKAYNFVFNIYAEFAKEHLERIKFGAASLPAVAKRTGLSFASTQLALEDMDSQQGSQGVMLQEQPEQSVSDSIKYAEMIERMDQERKMNRERKEKLEQKMEQQRQENQQQITKLLQQMEQERKTNREQQAELISLLGQKS